MPDLRVDIKTSADVSGANEATAALQRTTAAANALGESSTSSAEAAVKSQAAIEQAASSASKLTDALSSAAGAGDNATAAVQAVASRADAAVPAIDAATKNTVKLGGSFSDLIRRGSPAHELLDGILQGSLRSSTGVLALTRAVTGLSRGFALGGMGLFTTAVAGLAAVALLAAKNLKLTGESAEESQKKFQDAKKAADELGRTELTQLETALQRVTAQAERETKAFTELEAAKGKVANADLALRTAQIQNNPRLTAEQKVTEEIRVREQFQRAADARDLELSAKKVEEAKKVAQAASQNLLAPQAQVTAFDAETDRLRTLREQRAQLQADIQRNNEEQARRTPASTNIGNIGVATAGFNPESIRLNEELKKAPVISDEEVKASEARADAVRKTLEAEKEKARIAQETYADAQASYRLLEQTQKTVSSLTAQTTRVTAIPELVKARQEDRTTKAQRDRDLGPNPEAVKLTTANEQISGRIKELSDAILRSQQPGKSPENLARQGEIDSLTATRDQNLNQIDAFNRAPTKTDIRKSDLRAAGKDVSKDLKLDPKPIEDAETKKNDELLKLAQDNNAGLKGIADTITALPPPPKPDTGPVLSGLIEYNGQTVAAFRGVNQNFIEIGKILRTQAQQIESLSRQMSQASP